jgi:endonuclease YncB( thermonuclease family)
MRLGKFFFEDSVPKLQGLLLALFFIVGVTGCGRAPAAKRPTGAIPRTATIVLPTPPPTLAPSPVSTRVMPLKVITPIPPHAISPTPTPIPGEALGLVVGVIDGSTIRVVLEGDSMGDSYLVSYLGIESPPNNKESPWGVVSYETNRKMTGMKVVRLVGDKTNFDTEGRLLRYVYVADRLMNTWLPEQGLARVKIMTPDIRFKTEIAQAEDQAKTANVGVWGGQLPTPTPARYLTAALTITATATLSSPTATRTPVATKPGLTATSAATPTPVASPTPPRDETDLQGPE